VKERDGAAVLVNQHERWAPDPRPNAEAAGEPLDEARFARAERPGQRDDGARGAGAKK